MRARREASSAQRAATAAAPAEAQVRARKEVSAAQQYAAPAASAPAPAVALAAPEKPERWLERIAELRSRGRHEEADKQLAEFRRVYPDYRLTEIMRERVEGR